jgi:hypothetical protein
MLALCTTLWCRPPCTWSRFVHVVPFSSFDVVVLCTQLSLTVNTVTLSVFDVVVLLTHLQLESVLCM